MRYSRIPARAWRDPRMTFSHVKLLGAIALMDFPNTGCFASLPAIGRLYGWDRSYTWHLARDLRVWGYYEVRESADGPALVVRYIPEDHGWDDDLKRCAGAQRRKSRGCSPTQQGVVLARGKGVIKPLLPHVNRVGPYKDQTSKKQPRKRTDGNIRNHLAMCEGFAASKAYGRLRVERESLEQLIGGGFVSWRQRQRAKRLLTLIDGLQ